MGLGDLWVCACVYTCVCTGVSRVTAQLMEIRWLYSLVTGWFITSLHFDLCGLLSCFYYLSYGFIDSQSELLRLLKKVTKTGNINIYAEPPQANERPKNNSGNLPQSYFFQIHKLWSSDLNSSIGRLNDFSALNEGKRDGVRAGDRKYRDKLTTLSFYWLGKNYYQQCSILKNL